MIQIFEEKKIKYTKQREQVYNYLVNNEKNLLKDIINNNSNIDQSSIYRIINLFLKKGIIIKEVIDNSLYYLINKPHQHYIECANCHKKEVLNTCPFPNKNIQGYKIMEPEVVHGICCECQKKRIGIFVGSFNPPTKAHFKIGHLLFKNKVLDEIVFVPCNSLAKKKELLNIKDRFTMLNNYCQKYPYFQVSDIEIRNGKENFSYLELAILQKDYSNPLYIVLGADNLLNMHNWNNYEDLLHNYQFIVIKRLNIEIDDIINKYYSNYKNHFTIIDFNNNISSSKVRDLIKNRKDLNNYLDQEIIEYINKNNLYKD